MNKIDSYIEKISSSKSPVKEVLIVSSIEGIDYLDALLSRSLEVSNIRSAQAVFIGIKIVNIHNMNANEMNFDEEVVLKK